MATNLTTISVQLQANSQDFKKKIDGSRKKLQQFKKTTTSVSAGQAKFQKRLRDVAGSIAAVQGPLGPVAGRLNAIGAITGRVNFATLALLGSVTALSVLFVKFATAGARAESQTLKLEAILKATGNAAGQTSEDIEALAVSIGKNTLASVQGARDAAGVLLTFKSISGDTFGEVLKLSQDLAAVGFGSINTAALQLGKALEEPEIGLSALRRVGVSFTEQQKEQIKVLSLTGQQAQAQALIIKALKEQVGGAGEGAAGGLSGAFDTLGENITLFFEKSSIGKGIVSGLTSAVNALANALGRFVPDVEKLPDDLDQLNNRLKLSDSRVEFLAGKFKELGDQIEIQNSKAGSAAVQRSRKLKKQQDDINKQIFAEVELNNKIKEKIALINKEKEVVDKSAEITEKALRKIDRAREREIKNLQLEIGGNETLKILQQDINKLEDALISKLGDSEVARKKINDIIQAEILKRIENAQEQADEIRRLNDIKNIAGGVGSAFESAGRKITDAFVDGKTGALDFKAILRTLLADIQKTIIQVLILDRVKKAVTQVAGTIFGGILQSPTPRAAGGAVSSNRPTLVGERGPELFVPRTAGSITPSSLTPGKMGGGQPVVINQNLNFALGVTNTVRSEIANLLPTIQQSTLSAVSDAKLRGGKFAKAFGG